MSHDRERARLLGWRSERTDPVCKASFLHQENDPSDLFRAYALIGHNMNLGTRLLVGQDFERCLQITFVDKMGNSQIYRAITLYPQAHYAWRRHSGRRENGGSQADD